MTTLGISSPASTTRTGRTTSSSSARGLVYATDEVTERLADLQLVVGEGRCVEAHESGGPVLAVDLAEYAARWPAHPQPTAVNASHVFDTGMTTIGSVVGCGDPPAGSTVTPILSPGVIPSARNGRVGPGWVISPADRMPSGLITQAW
ncbi:hypothetical protein SAMN05421810_10969 [Amycolatopsis arida]|uniref:Uncharacterized protein n=1 Tax=Amycolatopsis arida TaxID=587909 RepID=A0A1I5ZDF8_9PSEU|nr:hypothetical protein CLV69_10968 [Amycolatopsis arida]SFQ54471.1 hypothetical protein SAMN05421810_10969 [Amycolatopsis arida]